MQIWSTVYAVKVKDEVNNKMLNGKSLLYIDREIALDDFYRSSKDRSPTKTRSEITRRIGFFI